MNIKIRKATETDLNCIYTFNKNIAFETEHIFLDDEKIQNGVINLLKNPSYGYYIVAEIENKIVGQLMITFEWSDWRNGLFLWIQSVYVLPEFRNKGIYRTLYNYVLTNAKSNKNVCGIRLYVEKNNKTARSVYNKLGMNEAEYAMYETDFVIKR